MGGLPGADGSIDLNCLAQRLVVDCGLVALVEALADAVAQLRDLGNVVEQTVEDTQEHSGLSARDKLGQMHAALEQSGPAVEGSEGIRDVVVLEELDDELAELLIAGLLRHQQVSGSVHVRAVFAVGLTLADRIQAEGDGRCDDRVLDQQLLVLVHVGGRRRGRRSDVVLEILDGTMEVEIFALLQLRLWIQTGQM